MWALALCRRMGRLQWLHLTMSAGSARGWPVRKEEASWVGMRFIVGVEALGVSTVGLVSCFAYRSSSSRYRL